ncbi:hypothetical protein [Nocardia asiatica]|uniref:hypothetical protein n=1 Tax=Nocardia asiatica TaxID=209252 RepID=UPI002453EB98|nr:hypothetical protein [Nocardia asiatica]
MAPTDDAMKRLYRDEAHVINARDVRFDFDSVPRLWQFWHATRRGVIPSWTVFFTELPRYLRPGCHPSQLGSMDTALLSPAARAVGR